MVSSQFETFSEEIPQEEEDLTPVDELEKSYVRQIEALQREHKKEMDILVKERERITRHWEIRLNSLSRLQKTSNVQRLIKRQNMILQLASNYRPKSDVNRQTSAHIAGKSLIRLMSSTKESPNGSLEDMDELLGLEEDPSAMMSFEQSAVYAPPEEDRFSMSLDGRGRIKGRSFSENATSRRRSVSEVLSQNKMPLSQSARAQSFNSKVTQSSVSSRDIAPSATDFTISIEIPSMMESSKKE